MISNHHFKSFKILDQVRRKGYGPITPAELNRDDVQNPIPKLNLPVLQSNLKLPGTLQNNLKTINKGQLFLKEQIDDNV